MRLNDRKWRYLNYPYTFNRRSLKSPKEGTFFIACCKSCRELIWIEEWVWCRGCRGGGGWISCYDKLLWNIYELNWNKMTKIQKICWSYLLQTSKQMLNFPWWYIQEDTKQPSLQDLIELFLCCLLVLNHLRDDKLDADARCVFLFISIIFLNLGWCQK